VIRLACRVALLMTTIAIAAGGVALGAARSRSGAATRVGPQRLGGGIHQRLGTRNGPIHIFRPARYDRRTAGIVVYVHGYYAHADAAWREHRLGEQFAASRRNALFIVPEAPASGEEASSWTNLGRLLTTVFKRTGLPRPGGPLVVVGHSAAYRTIAPWLVEPSLHSLILVDAMYGNEGAFREWLDRTPSNQMTLVVKGTAKWADPFVRAFPDAVSMPRIPDSIDELTDEQQAAKLLHLESQYGHFELITEGKTLPVLLRRTPLPAIRLPAVRRPTRR
jgi:hypothetical protein